MNYRMKQALASSVAALLLLASACSVDTSSITQPDVSPPLNDPSATEAPTADPTPTAVAPSATPTPTEDAATEVAAESDAPEDAADKDAAGLPDAAAMRETLERIGYGYTGLGDKWPGFVPGEHPVVLAYKGESGELLGALAINHPKPEALGDATKIDTEGMPFDSVYRIENPTDKAALTNLAAFDFHAILGGIDSFAMNVIDGDDFFDPHTDDYTATLLHELFHRYQDEAFAGRLGAQDVNGYAYTPENLELACSALLRHPSTAACCRRSGCAGQLAGDVRRISSLDRAQPRGHRRQVFL